MSSKSENELDSSDDKQGIAGGDPKIATSASITAVQVPRVPTQFADGSYKLFSEIGQIDDPTLEEARIIRNKCIKWILPFICVGYHVMYVDKQTVSWPILR
jgi:hypothetical protein